MKEFSSGMQLPGTSFHQKSTCPHASHVKVLARANVITITADDRGTKTWYCTEWVVVVDTVPKTVCISAARSIRVCAHPSPFYNKM